MTFYNDYCNCANMKDDCPDDCFRKQVTKETSELAKNSGEPVICSLSNFYGTDECPLTG